MLIDSAENKSKALWTVINKEREWKTVPLTVIPNIPDTSVKTSVNFLDITLDNNLNSTDHINNLCNKISSGIFALKQIKWIGTQEAARIAYHAFVESHIRYGL